ncbi:hypothetical protein UFOVP703_13 [uncultured Caudovirales phage]|uniref:Uncharacterized protein n=1 Tax=uncultured Caudovirales phage TaxID=2100421 RepID=A0A6J5NID9_9CAUD|nr:hypothetical protein UFOVP703_13 [uncultured Caudovirales phage]
MAATARRVKCGRLLGVGYAQILRMVVDGPVSWLEVTAKMGLARATSQRVLRGFVRQGLAYTAHWLPPASGGGAPRPYYALGPGVCAVRPRCVELRQNPTPPELLAFCDLIKALQARPWTKAPLAAYLGHDGKAVRQTVDALHRLRLVHIDEYQARKSGAGYPMFTWGPDLEDAKKPKPMTAQQLNKRGTARRTALRRHMRMIQATASQAGAQPFSGCVTTSSRPPPSLRPTLGDAGASSAAPPYFPHRCKEPMP